MREILFRGRKTGFNEWVHGLITSPCEKTMCELTQTNPKISWYVDAETVGQYTGLTDKNGTKIFEGDIVKFAYNEEDENPVFYSVEWKNDRACFGYAETADKMIEVDSLHCVVIGNIHDNPKLLKEVQG